MLLVLGVIAAFAGMTVPSVLRMHGQRKLTESAERVRAMAASARVRAIESGLVYQFCCETNGNHFVVVPFEADHASATGGGTGAQAAPVNMLSRAYGVLPKGVVFSSTVMGISGNLVASSGSHKIAMTFLEGLPNASDLANLNWSQPILFNSDGSANADAQIVVSDSKAQHITLRVRAFTGAVSMERISAGKHK
jgi:hypothetical protein